MSKVVSFPQSKPTVVNDHMRNYDLSFLLSNTSNVAAKPPQSAPMPAPVIDVPRPCTIEDTCIHGPAPAPPVMGAQEPALTGVTSSLQAPVAGDFVPAPAEALTIHALSPPPPGVTIRGRARKSFPWKFTDGTIQYDPNRRAFFAEPTSHRMALSEPA
ncbi:hypothetical protein L6452_44126 [Arctium lappa]|uniref:Uncharacterized protein n=1 Tax=Arctium lappa TaxID=4217 RepID=A0ACB8XGM9_ARCLA|nr:hypothetical protein L6452_44126 [Arctium lappa]